MRAVIVKKTAVNEYDEQIVCYTEERGKIIAVAKSILKPHSKQSMHLDFFNLVDFELVGGSAGGRMPIITGAQAARTYLPIKSSLLKTAAASFFMEVVDKVMYEHQRDQRFWDFLIAVLDELAKISEPEVMDFFKNSQKKLAAIMGYGDRFQELPLRHAFASLDFLSAVLKYNNE